MWPPSPLPPQSPRHGRMTAVACSGRSVCGQAHRIEASGFWPGGSVSRWPATCPYLCTTSFLYNPETIWGMFIWSENTCHPLPPRRLAARPPHPTWTD